MLLMFPKQLLWRFFMIFRVLGLDVPGLFPGAWALTRATH